MFFNQGMRSHLDPTGVYGKENTLEEMRSYDGVEEKQLPPNPKREGCGTTRRTPKERGSSAASGMVR